MSSHRGNRHLLLEVQEAVQEAVVLELSRALEAEELVWL